MNRRDLLAGAAAFGLPVLLPAATRAQAPAAAGGRKLTIAFGDLVSSLDPQLNNLPGDRSSDLHLFDLLVRNEYNELRPGLALSWTLVDPTTWDFALRPGVKWSDGRDFTADDVVFSYARAPNVAGSVANFGGYLRTVASVEALEPLRLRVKTREPNPLLPLNLASVHIVSRHGTEGATSNDFNTGKALINTGPYRMVSYTQGERTLLRANPSYWDGAPYWAEVDYRYVANAASRTAALLAGDVDVIDKVSVSDLAQLRARPEVKVFAYPGLRMLLLQPSFAPGPNRFITDNDGKTFEKSPLLDQRVRQALSIAINRQALCERLLLGTANPTGQWMPEGTFGFNPDVPVPGYDPDGARKLLAEAGYPNGFQLTIHVPNDRYILGPQTIQAIGQMWSRIGVKTSVEAQPWAVYAAAVTKNEYAMSTLAWGNGTGEGTYAMTNVLGSFDARLGRGVSNWGRYASAEMDAALDAAMQEFDDNKREAIVKNAAVTAARDVGIIPLLHYQNVWAARRGLKVTPLSSDRTVAMMVSPE